MDKYQRMTKNACVKVGNAAHMTMIDQPKKMAEAVTSFLRSMDKNRFLFYK